MKRSAVGASDKRLESVIIVMDENIAGHSILEVLNRRGIRAESQLKYTPRGVFDDDLVAALAPHPNLVLVTKDRDFRYKRDLVEKLPRLGLRIFVLSGLGSKTGEQIAAQILDAWPALRRFLKRNPPPFVAHVRADGTAAMHHGRGLQS
jgi:predicted nuclease of predicted toxin-antitoxin system